MPKAKLDAGAWIVVCDGGKALVLQNVGDEKFPNLQTRETYTNENPPAREQGTDVPGRVQPSVGTSRSAVEETDWHAQAERAFLRRLCRHLDQAVMSGKAKSIVLVAPPRAMGVLREELSQAARETVRAEIARDLTNLPAYEIEKRLVENSES
ncbi:MAG TPA: host attachment protein [Xanthobacteraceae bacterium]|nr:host attachment protein [Xanthobacteraceae bacterium]